MSKDFAILMLQSGFVLVALLAIVTLVSLIGRRAWPIELFQHFRPHLVLAGLVGVALFGTLFLFGWGIWEMVAISLGLTLINYAALPTRKFVKPDARVASQPGITIVWANVWKKPEAMKRALAWAAEQKADVVLLGEFPAVDSSDVTLAPDYPHRLDSGPQLHSPLHTRVAAFSRLPMIEPVVHHYDEPARQVLIFAVEAPGEGVLNIAALHPNAPVGPRMLRGRTATFERLGKLVRQPFLAAADFNCTPWASGYADLPGVRIGDAMRESTWLSRIPLLGLAIDHLMISTDVKVSDYRVGPRNGSDHLPLIARVHPPAKV